MNQFIVLFDENQPFFMSPPPIICKCFMKKRFFLNRLNVELRPDDPKKKGSKVGEPKNIKCHTVFLFVFLPFHLLLFFTFFVSWRPDQRVLPDVWRLYRPNLVCMHIMFLLKLLPIYFKAIYFLSPTILQITFPVINYKVASG